MGYITEDYCSEELSGMLMERGYIGATNTYLGKDDINVKQITLQSAMKWLRKTHDIYIDIITRFSLNADKDVCYSFEVKQLIDEYTSKYLGRDGEWYEYEEACEAAIKFCLEKLN